VALPIQLNAFQALTGRYTAGVGDVSSNKSDGLNFQNLPKHGDTSLRRSIIAPPGYVLIGGDSSQIECRVLAWLSGQMDLVELFRNHGDPYSDFAETLSGIPAAEIYHGAKVTHDPKLYEWRDIAKRLILGSGYGLGGARQAKLLRHKNIKLAPTWDEHEQKAIEYTHIYRTRFPSIKLFWKTCDQVLYGLTTQCQDYFTPAKIRIDFAYSIIARIGYTQPALILPNKFPIIYPDLRFDSASGNYSYKIWVKKKEVERSIYGAQVTAHVTQGLAFALLWWQGLRINERYKVIGNVHDSWIALVPEEEAVEAREYIYECLTTLPDWLVGLPIDAEVNIGHTYDVA
jgi:DNA polymerase